MGWPNAAVAPARADLVAKLVCRGTVCVVAAIVLAVPPAARADDVDRLVVQARSQLAARDAQAALDTLAQIDRRRGAAPAGFDQLFLQGVIWQELAAGATGAEREQALQRSRQAYLQALEQRPGTAAVFNNLAALSQLGTERAAAEAEAAGWYQRAVDAGGSRRGYYALNYAQALAERDPEAALRYARLALDADPDSEAARNLVGRLLVALPDSAALVRFGVRAVAAGHTRMAAGLALEALRAVRPERTPEWRAGLLGLVALALARDPVTLAQPPRDELLDALRKLAGDPVVGDGSRQLAAALQGPSTSTAAVSWWDNRALAGLERTRRALMREVLRLLGEQRIAADAVRAEGWLRMAVELGDRGPDPDAFLRLVELYAGKRQLPQLQQLMRNYEFELFTEKGAAYQRNDWALIYRLHLALGMTYAYLQVWTSPQSAYQNAVFQLENAARAAERFNADAQRRRQPERLALPPAAAIKLSEAYTAVGQADRAARVRVDAAQTLLDVRRPADSAELLQTVSAEDLARLSAADQAKFTRLQQLTRP